MPANLLASLAASKDSDAESEQAQTPEQCMPCEGRGSVISRLGGEERSVSCPWCEGSGVRRKGVDAQSGWSATQGGEDAAADPAGSSEGDPSSDTGES